MGTTVYPPVARQTVSRKPQQPLAKPFAEVTPSAPPPGPSTTLGVGDVMGRIWGQDAWSPVGGGAPLNDAPTDGFTYGRRNAAWESVLNLMGGTMIGYTILNADPRPTSPLDAATKQYVDDQVANGTYRGAWQVAANTPVLNPPVPAQVNGDRWLCVTADPATPENPPAGMPGLPVTTLLSNGDMIIWSELQASWAVTRNGGLTRPIADDLYVNVSGDTMIGALIVRDPPTLNFEAVHKQYVDQRIFTDVVGPGTWGRVVGAWQRSVALSGDIMTGFLTLNADPVADLHAATKAYVDARDLLDAPSDTFAYGRLDAAWARVVPLAGGTMTGLLTLSGAPTVNLHAATKLYVDTEDLLRVARAGDTMTGPLILFRDPVINMEAATKQYIDDAIDLVLDEGEADLRYVRLAGGNPGGNMTGTLTLTPAAQTLPAHAATRGQAILRTGGADGIMTGKLTLAPAQQTLPDDATPRSQAIMKAGDTMVGKLTLVPAQQVQLADAAYIGYVDDGLDDRVLKVGDNMTGPIITTALTQPPDPPGQLVTKSYVDGLSSLVPIGATPPANPQPGQLWWRNDPDGVLYIRYADDAGSEQWVPASPSGGAVPPPLTFGGQTPIAYTGTEIANQVVGTITIPPADLPATPFDYMISGGNTFCHNIGGTGQPTGTMYFQMMYGGAWQTIATFQLNSTNLAAGTPSRTTGSGNALSNRIWHYDPAVNTAGMQFQMIVVPTLPSQAATFTCGLEFGKVVIQ